MEEMQEWDLKEKEEGIGRGVRGHGKGDVKADDRVCPSLIYMFFINLQCNHIWSTNGLFCKKDTGPGSQILV